MNTKRDKSRVMSQLDGLSSAVEVVRESMKGLPEPPVGEALDPEKDLDLVGKTPSVTLVSYSHVRRHQWTDRLAGRHAYENGKLPNYTSYHTIIRIILQQYEDEKTLTSLTQRFLHSSLRGDKVRC